MKILKKLICYILILTFLFTSVDITAFAQETDYIEVSSEELAEGVLSMGGTLSNGITPFALVEDTYDHSHDEELVEVWENFGSSINTTGWGLTKANVSDVIYDLINYNPQIFYLSQYRCSYNVTTDEVTAVFFTYTDTEENLSPAIKELNDAIAKVNDEVDVSDLSDIEIALAYHDYLVSHVAYDYDDYLADTLSDSVYNMYGTLVNKEAVCQGYAVTLLYLLKQHGINVGYASSDDADHAWNIIEDNGNWYHIDATWDDPTWDTPGYVRHKYFMINTEDLLVDSPNKSDFTVFTAPGETFTATTANDYASMLWDFSNAAFYSYEGNLYGIQHKTYFGENEHFSIIKWDIDTNTSESLWQGNTCWIAGEDTYSKLIAIDNFVYFSTANEIKSLNLDTAEAETIFEYTGKEGSIFAFGWLKDDVVYSITTSPFSTENDERIVLNRDLLNNEKRCKHQYESISDTPATEESDGYGKVVCRLCDRVQSEGTITRIESVTLNQTSFPYFYNQVQRPVVIAKDANGKVIPEWNYDIIYSNENSIESGEYSLTVNFKGNYSGSKTFYYEIFICEHDFKDYITAATNKTDGLFYNACSICGELTTEKTVIPRIGTVKLDKTEFIADGQFYMPEVIVLDINGDPISSEYYIVRGSSVSTPGEYQIQVVFQKYYLYVANLYFTLIECEHNFVETVIRKATPDENGRKSISCSHCGMWYRDEYISSPSPYIIDEVSFQYNGTVQKPTVSVTDAYGTIIPAEHYTISYSNANSKDVGEYTVTVTFKGDYYSGSITNTYTISCEHDWTALVTSKATPDKDGEVTYSCSKCALIHGTEVLPRIDDITLSDTEFTYSGNVQKPTVGTITNIYGDVIDSSNYTITYSNPNSKEIGKYQVTITFDSEYYSGTVVKSYEIRCTSHHYETITLSKATLEKNGEIASKCSLCGSIQWTNSIAKINNISLSNDSYEYNTNIQKPTIKVTDANGLVIASSNYTVAYSNANSQSPGTYNVTVTFKGNYSGTKTLTYTIKECVHSSTSTTLTKATTSKNGKKVTTCDVCSKVIKTTTIAKIKSISLSTTKYVYNGKSRKPSVTVKDSKGQKISTKNYTVSYSNNKNVGTAKVTIKFKGNYSGTKSLSFTINPKETTLKSLTAKKKGMSIKWNKLTSQTTGYQIQYSTSSKFSSSKTKTIKITKNTSVSKTISSLKANKKYYVRIRTYKVVKGKYYYSDWSKYKTIKTKK